MTTGDATPHELARATIFESDGFEREPAVIVARAFLALEAELQAAQERETEALRKLEMEKMRRDAAFLREALRNAHTIAERREIIATLAAQRTEEPSEQRFTEKGAECRNTHVKGYTGPICSCPPLACFAVERTEEPSE